MRACGRRHVCLRVWPMQFECSHTQLRRLIRLRRLMRLALSFASPVSHMSHTPPSGRDDTSVLIFFFFFSSPRGTTLPHPGPYPHGGWEGEKPTSNALDVSHVLDAIDAPAARRHPTKRAKSVLTRPRRPCHNPPRAAPHPDQDPGAAHHQLARDNHPPCLTRTFVTSYATKRAT